jgi:hypothetical protein
MGKIKEATRLFLDAHPGIAAYIGVGSDAKDDLSTSRGRFDLSLTPLGSNNIFQ